MRQMVRWGAVLGAVALTAGCAEMLGNADADTDEPADPATLAERAEYYGVPPGLVLMVDGFVPAPGGGGAYGADGYAAVLVEDAEESTDVVMLSAVPGTIDAATCPELPVLTTTGTTAQGTVECSADGATFSRTAGTWHDYAVERDGAVVRISSDGVEPDVLRAALESVRVPTVGELDTILPPMTPPSPSGEAGSPSRPPTTSPSPSPVERGDLPPGDGAPDNSVGLGG
ncbi:MULTISPECIES: hypothetical protein [Isoptericola]|nr:MULTISPECIES: hypothetical protein [Isoptericola]